MIFQEKASDIKADWPELEKMMSQLRKGDVVCIYNLERLGRSLKNLLELVAEFEKRGVGLRSLTDSIDTTTPQGRFWPSWRGTRFGSEPKRDWKPLVPGGEKVDEAAGFRPKRRKKQCWPKCITKRKNWALMKLPKPWVLPK